MHWSLSRSLLVELDMFRGNSKSIKVEEAWVLFELYQADCMCRDPWKSIILGDSTLFKKGDTAYARLLSKSQTRTIICADLRDAMAIIRQRERTTPGQEFLWSCSVP